MIEPMILGYNTNSLILKPMTLGFDTNFLIEFWLSYLKNNWYLVTIDQIFYNNMTSLELKNGIFIHQIWSNP